MKRQLFTTAALLLAVTHNHAQELPQSPSQWSSFISADKNLLVEHTLLKQSFETEASDQWEYTTDGTFVDLITYGINKIYDDKALKLTINQHFTLNPIPHTPYLDYYSDVKTWVNAAGYKTIKGCILETEHQSSTEKRIVKWITINKASEYTFPFANTNPSAGDITYLSNQ